MVLHFKVYRLQREKLGRKKHVTQQQNMRLVLRDKKGRILHVCRSPEEEYKIKKWYERYNAHTSLEQLIGPRRLKEHIRKVKALIRDRGFTFRISIYGIFKNPKTGRGFYCRYEIFKATKWTQNEFRAVHVFFKNHRPKSAAGVFVYHNDKLLVWGEDKVTTHRTQTLDPTIRRSEPQIDGTLQIEANAPA